MKIVIPIYNTLISLIAIGAIGRALYISYLYGFRARLKSIPFLLAEDKILYEQLMRVKMWAMLILELVAFSHMLNRLILNFPPWPGPWVMVSSLILFTMMPIVSIGFLVSYDDSIVKFFTRRKKDPDPPSPKPVAGRSVVEMS